MNTIENNANEITYNFLKNFYHDKRVLITGAHGFKATWLVLLMESFGAHVLPIGIPAKKDNDLNKKIQEEMLTNNAHIDPYKKIDVRNFSELEETVKIFQPDIVFHLAAVSTLNDALLDPIKTYETNIIGTGNVLEVVSKLQKKTSTIIVTSDKVYKNNDTGISFKENDRLGGNDPYSASKASADILAQSYMNLSYNVKAKRSYYRSLSVVRCGNTIGGGDFTIGRIIYDCVNAWQNQQLVALRKPLGTRPYIHVLDALNAYIILAAKQYNNIDYAGCYNIGPNPSKRLTNQMIAQYAHNYFVIDPNNMDAASESLNNKNLEYYEKNFLSIDSTLFRNTFNWDSSYSNDTCAMLDKVFSWYDQYYSGMSPYTLIHNQIKEFFHIDK